MKRILLTSTALFAMAGAAAADVTWSGDAKLGYNQDVKKGFYWDGGLFVKATRELNSGLEAGFSLDVDLQVKNNTFAQGGATSVATSDFVVFLKSDNAGLYFGDTKTAVESIFLGGLKTPVRSKNFLGHETFIEDSNTDAGLIGTAGNAATAGNGSEVLAILRGDYSMGATKVSVSGLVYRDATIADGVVATGKYTQTANTANKVEVGGMQLAVTTEVSNWKLGFALQQEDKNIQTELSKATGVTTASGVDGMVGFYANTSFSGVDVGISHVANTTTKKNSTGLKAAYTFGSIKAGVYYSSNTGSKNDDYGVELQYAAGPIKADLYYDANENNSNTVGLEGSYDFNNGLVVKAGAIGARSAAGVNTSSYYLGGEYDLGNSAKLLVSFAGDNKAGATSAIGAPEYNEGATVQVSFKF